MKAEQRAERNKAICELRKQNKSMAEIAAALGCSESIVSVVSRANNLGGNKAGYVKRGPASDAAKNARYERDRQSYVDRLSRNGFNYVGGYTNSDGYIFARCACGHEFRVACQTIRRHFVDCPECAAAEKEREGLAYENAKKHAKEARRIFFVTVSMNSALKKMEKEKLPPEGRVCYECGNLFYKKASNQKYCSDKCAKRHMNREHSVRREKSKTHLSIKKLYNRDGGICYLCGCTCDFSDHQIREDGSFITGSRYPTVEHVIPLSKGGPDTWDNVKLACHGCNTAKGSRSYFAERKDGQIMFA